MATPTQSFRRVNNLPADSKVLICHSFYSRNQLMPSPKGDFYSATFGCQYAGKNDIAVVFTQPPGLIELRKKVIPGFAQASVIELPTPPALEKLGYPDGSIIDGLFRHIEQAEDGSSMRAEIDGSYLYCLFPYPGLATRAAEYGISVPQDHDSGLLNSKIYLHQNSKRYGFHMPRHMVLESERDLRLLNSLPRDSSAAWWLKGPGSGGDLVQKIERPIETNIWSGWTTLKDRIVTAFEGSKFSDVARTAFVDPDSLFPKEGLLLEEDVSAFGQTTINGTAVLHSDGRGGGECLGLYSQDLSRRPWIGAFKLHYDPVLLKYLSSNNLRYEDIEPQIVAELLRVNSFMADNRFRGVYGVDYFLALAPHQIRVVICEVNARITTDSGGCRIFEDSTGYKYQMPLTLNFPEPVNSVADLAKYCQLDNGDTLLSPSEDGMIHPQNFGCIWTSARGYPELITESNLVRLMLLSNSSNGISRLVKHMLSSGAKPSFYG